MPKNRRKWHSGAFVADKKVQKETMDGQGSGCGSVGRVGARSLNTVTVISKKFYWTFVYYQL